MIEISIIIPVYNNKPSLKKLFNELMKIRDNFLNRQKEIEILFIDDGWKDNSFEELLNLKKLFKNLKIIKLLKNYGSNNAVQIGLNEASGNYVCVLSADLQDNPNLILKMYDVIINENENLVICERRTREDSILSLVLAKLFYKLFLSAVDVNYPKNGFDVFMIKKDLLKNINTNLRNPTISLMIATQGYKFKKIDYDRSKREFGKSEWTFKKKMSFFWDIFIRYSDLPIKIVSRFGFLFSLISFMYGIYILSMNLINGSEVQGFTTIAVLISFCSGLIIFTLGLVGEYLIRIYKIVEKNEEVIIEKII